MVQQTAFRSAFRWAEVEDGTDSEKLEFAASLNQAFHSEYRDHVPNLETGKFKVCIGHDVMDCKEPGCNAQKLELNRADGEKLVRDFTSKRPLADNDDEFDRTKQTKDLVEQAPASTVEQFGAQPKQFAEKNVSKWNIMSIQQCIL